MGLRHSNERLNTVALVADILEGHGRYTVSQELREKVEMAARDERESEAKLNTAEDDIRDKFPGSKRA